MGLQQGGMQQGGMGMGAHMIPVIDPQFCLPQEVVYLIKEDLMSASDLQDNKRFILDAHAMSIKSARELKTVHGQTVASMTKKMMKDFWLICKGAGASKDNRVASMRKDKVHNQDCASIFLTNNASLHFANAMPDYQARGDLKARAFHIFYRGQQCCAEISRKESTTNKMTGKDAYAIRILPGFDAAFLLCICCLLDELFSD
eukprot:jgi/Astpho2/9181/Aster-x0387